MASGHKKHRPALALIPPVELLEYTDLTQYQLMLAQLTGFDEYNYVYKTHCKDGSQFVILDNGAAEGSLVSDHQLIDVALAFMPNEMVIPDQMGDRLGTQAAARQFLNSLELRKETNPELDEIPLMYVIQGEDFEDFVKSAIWAAEKEWINTIGIPRHALTTCGRADARAALADMLWGITPKLVHLLGANVDYPFELMDNVWTENVRSTDTSMPFNYAYAGKKIRRGNFAVRPEEYFTQPATHFSPDLVDYNVDMFRRWTR